MRLRARQPCFPVNRGNGVSGTRSDDQNDERLVAQEISESKSLAAASVREHQLRHPHQGSWSSTLLSGEGRRRSPPRMRSAFEPSRRNRRRSRCQFRRNQRSSVRPRDRSPRRHPRRRRSPSGLLRLSGPPCVAGERVERVACVRHLPLAVGPPGQAEQGGAYAASRPWLRGAEERRPVCRAGSVAGTDAALVLLEQVERAAACVDEHLAERRLSRARRGLPSAPRADDAELVAPKAAATSTAPDNAAAAMNSVILRFISAPCSCAETSTPSTKNWIAPAARPAVLTVSVPARVSISRRSFATSG